MNLNISSHHVPVTESLKNYIHAKFTKMEKHDSKISNVYIRLLIDKHFQQRITAKVNLRGLQIYGDASSADMYASIDVLEAKLKRQIIRHKEKLHGHHGGNLL